MVRTKLNKNIPSVKNCKWYTKAKPGHTAP